MTPKPFKDDEQRVRDVAAVFLAEGRELDPATIAKQAKVSFYNARQYLRRFVRDNPQPSADAPIVVPSEVQGVSTENLTLREVAHMIAAEQLDGAVDDEETESTAPDHEESDDHGDV